MAKQSGVLLKIRNEYQEKLNIAVARAERMTVDGMKFSQIRESDFVAIALGRLGWSAKEIKDFFDKVEEVGKDYEELLIDDFHNDQEYWYSHKKIDDELSEYMGEWYVPFEERYKL